MVWWVDFKGWGSQWGMLRYGGDWNGKDWNVNNWNKGGMAWLRIGMGLDWKG